MIGGTISVRPLKPLIMDKFPTFPQFSIRKDPLFFHSLFDYHSTFSSTMWLPTSKRGGMNHDRYHQIIHISLIKTFGFHHPLFEWEESFRIERGLGECMQPRSGWMIAAVSKSSGGQMYLVHEPCEKQEAIKEKIRQHETSDEYYDVVHIIKEVGSASRAS